jgi:predicted transcriptional regulator
MTVTNIVKILDAKVYTGDDKLETVVQAACGADLMSDVMAFVKEEVVLLTGLVTIQAIRTAIIMDVSVVVFVRGKKPMQDVVNLARENNIILLSTNLPMFLACGKLYAAGLVAGGTREIGEQPVGR